MDDGVARARRTVTGPGGAGRRTFELHRRISAWVYANVAPQRAGAAPFAVGDEWPAPRTSGSCPGQELPANARRLSLYVVRHRAITYSVPSHPSLETAMQGFLTRPVPIIFAVCQGVQQLANGAFNILGIFDRMTVPQLPDGTLPDAVTLQVVTVWTGGVGHFEHLLRLLDADMNPIVEVRAEFDLGGTSHRHYIISFIAVPMREGVHTMTVGRGDEVLLRQDFTIAIAPAAGSAP